MPSGARIPSSDGEMQARDYGRENWRERVQFALFRRAGLGPIGIIFDYPSHVATRVNDLRPTIAETNFLASVGVVKLEDEICLFWLRLWEMLQDEFERLLLAFDRGQNLLPHHNFQSAYALRHTFGGPNANLFVEPVFDEFTKPGRPLTALHFRSLN